MKKIIPLLIATGFILSCSENNENTSERVVDVDGNSYEIATIGSQVWMAENLKVTRDSNGEAIDNSIPNDTESVNTYGRLYNWNSALKVCPKGWHLPSGDEWFTLLSHLDKSITDPGATGFLGKETGTALRSPLLWPMPVEVGTNVTGFSALPSGFSQSGVVLLQTCVASFWSSTEGNEDQSFGGIAILCDSSSVFRGYMNKPDGHCVRCLKD